MSNESETMMESYGSDLEIMWTNNSAGPLKRTTQCRTDFGAFVVKGQSCEWAHESVQFLVFRSRILGSFSPVAQLIHYH